MEQANTQQKRQFWIGMGLSLLCLVAIFLLIDPRQIWDALISADYGYFALGVLAFFGFLLLRAVRWRFMLNNDIGYWQLFHIQNIGFMGNYILPARLGELIRAVLVGSVPPITMGQGVSTMVVERLLDVIFMVTFLPFTLASVETLPDGLQSAALNLGILAVIGSVVLIYFANRRENAGKIAQFFLDKIPFLDTDTWLKRLDELLKGLDKLTRFQDGITLVAMSIIVWIPVLFGYYWICVAVGLDVSIMMAGFVMCAAAFSIAAPSSPGQVGVYHAGVIFAINIILGLPESQAASFAFLYHGMTTVFSILTGIIGLNLTQSTFGKVVTLARDFARKGV
jgi:uncharacterized protein (TIRG00374 family)